MALPSVPHWKETFSDSVRRLCRDGIDKALTDLFVHATLQFDLDKRVVSHADASDAVRKFLFERLESWSETKGRFQVGVRLPIPCGVNPYLAVSLAALRQKLVVMLDRVSDLSERAAYRRRRREDALLQSKGYRILRFLVEDVCEHLDDVLDALVAACEDAAHARKVLNGLPVASVDAEECGVDNRRDGCIAFDRSPY